MPKSIELQLHTYKGYIDILLKRIKKNPDVSIYKEMYKYYETEYSNLLSYVFEPGLTDEEYAHLETY